MNNSFYSEEDLPALGLRSFGNNVLISRFARFYNASEISVGSNVRIDDFCILSGNISLGNYVHISAYSAMYGKFGIILEDFTGLSPRCTIFSATDDFSGNYLIGPMIDEEYLNVTGGLVTIRRFVQIGSNTVILPGIVIEEGVAVGAMSLIKNNLSGWGIYAGIPARFLRNRERKLVQLSNYLINK